MAFPVTTYTNAQAAGALFNAAALAGLDLSGLQPIAQVQSALANLLQADPTTIQIPAGDVLSGILGANKSGGADTGDYTFPAAAIATTKLTSITALATPSAYVATTGTLFASTVSGAAIMGFGTTHDVALKNQAGTTVLGITANTTGVTMAGALAMTGALSGVTTFVASSTGSLTGLTFTTSVSSVTALATPGAYVATTGTVFASTVSGATLMGFGTTGDVTLKNRAGTDVIVVTANTTGVTMAGALAMTGALSGVTSMTFSTNEISTTALATPGAIAATQYTAFASTVSGATLMGFGTTGDVTLKNRAGTDVIVVTSNTTGVTMAGALAMTGALSGVTTLVASSTATIGTQGNTLINLGAAAAAANSITQFAKTTTAIADNTATAILTVTVPNAAHSATVRLHIRGSLGAGGAIGANENSAVVSYDIAVARTAGVAMAAVISVAYGAITAPVAGAATMTCVAAITLNGEGVGSTNTATIKVTIAHGSGSSTNHTATCFAQVLNANATGVTLS